MTQKDTPGIIKTNESEREGEARRDERRRLRKDDARGRAKNWG